mgnify:CR=1 FL=1
MFEFGENLTELLLLFEFFSFITLTILTKNYLEKIAEELYQEYPKYNKNNTTKNTGTQKFLQMTVIQMLLKGKNIDNNTIEEIKSSYVNNKEFFNDYFNKKKYNKILQDMYNYSKSNPFANWKNLANIFRRLLYLKKDFNKVNEYLKDISSNIISDCEFDNESLKQKTDGFLGNQGYGRNVPVIVFHDKKFKNQKEAIQICLHFQNNVIDTYIQSGKEDNYSLNEFISNTSQYQQLIEDIKNSKEDFIKKTNNRLNSKDDLSYKQQIGEDKSMHKNIPLNQILYGPPGTGKTYKLENIIKDYIYPQIADDHESTNIYDDILLNCDLNWVEKIIFAFKINNSQNKPLTDVQISKLPLIQRWFSISSNYKDEKSLICSIRGEMQKNAIRKEGVYARHENNYFERQENGFILIDDGEKLYNELCEHYDININYFDNNIQTDKSILAKDYYVFCTFHQSYSYEEFVEGIRPIINKCKQDETSKDKNLSTMQFDFHCGIFKDMCIKAKKEPNKKFFIFIDEINRGNISKIFGELITLIEKDKREKVVEDGREYHTIEVTLPYTNDRFTVPNNLYIVGTMNTADKSLALLDVALRRRFEFVPMYPKYDLKDLKHKEFLEALNDRIYFEKKSADFIIGHTYFLGSEAEDLSEVMNKKVTPLLMEYFNAKKEMVEDIVGPLLEKEGYCIDKNEKYLLKVVRK